MNLIELSARYFNKREFNSLQGCKIGQDWSLWSDFLLQSKLTILYKRVILLVQYDCILNKLQNTQVGAYQLVPLVQASHKPI